MISSRNYDQSSCVQGPTRPRHSVRSNMRIIQRRTNVLQKIRSINTNSRNFSLTHFGCDVLLCDIFELPIHLLRELNEKTNDSRRVKATCVGILESAFK